jgi:hypothetical protein
MKRLTALLTGALLTVSLLLPTAVFAGNREDLADNFELGLNQYNDIHCGGYDVDPNANRENLEEWRQSQRANGSGWPDAHTDASGKKVWDYADTYGVRDWTGAGEIVANLSFWPEGDSDGDGIFNGVEQIINAWHNSSGHRAIMQTCEYDSFGAGVYIKADGTVWIGVIYTDQPWKYAKAEAGTSGIGIYSTSATTACGATKLGVVPDNARLIQYDHRFSSCDGHTWYRLKHQESGLYGWAKYNKVSSVP